MALDYPTMDHAQRALADGRLSVEEYVQVSNAWLARRPPPQTTRPAVTWAFMALATGIRDSRDRQLTDGCIAVTNEQIDELAHWVVVAPG